jgi:hypothetical protein
LEKKVAQFQRGHNKVDQKAHTDAIIGAIIDASYLHINQKHTTSNNQRRIARPVREKF